MMALVVALVGAAWLALWHIVSAPVVCAIWMGLV